MKARQTVTSGLPLMVGLVNFVTAGAFWSRLPDTKRKCPFVVSSTSKLGPWMSSPSISSDVLIFHRNSSMEVAAVNEQSPLSKVHSNSDN